jgi:predicted XRE-type DNA-binding protein
MTGGMVVPYVWGILFLDEEFSFLRMVGLAFIIGAAFVIHAGGRKISSKIMPDVRLKIQKLYQEGKSQKELAEIFDVSQSQISVIVRNTKNTSDNKELFEHCWYWEKLIENLNILRDKYLDTKDYKYFRLIRQLMPMSYLYKSTITMNYENILSMVHQRKNHKLTEWSVDFIDWVKTLPYAE